MRNGWSIRTRLTVAASAFMALICCVVSILVIIDVRKQERQYQTEKAATAALQALTDLQRGDDRRALTVRKQVRGLSGVQVVDGSGEVAAGTNGYGTRPRISTLVPDPDAVRRDKEVCSLPGFAQCEIVVVFRYVRGGADWFVYGFAEAVPWYGGYKLVYLLAVLIPLMIALAGAGTWLIVGRALKPVDDIRADTQRIAESGLRGLDQRLRLPGHDDELRALAVTSNEVLDMLESSLKRERRFIANASHDLRTPITALRTELDEAALYPDDIDWTETTERMTASLDRLQDLVQDLLTLTRIEAGVELRTEPLDLAVLARSAAERSAEPPELALEPAPVVGDPEQLGRLLDYLLDQAAHHAAGSITVTTRTDGESSVLEVSDDGGPPSEDLRASLSDRFSLPDTERGKAAAGSGLRLSIAAELALAHGGTLAVAGGDTTT
ncbi:sensor histidine kinase, partial [Actinocorallia lasiicapitis]